MSGDFPFAAKIVSPAKCNEKPWDLWVSEIGHLSPRRDEGAPADKAAAAAAARSHPYKPERRARRPSHHRLKLDTMSLHGLFPQMDNLNAAVCHMCGVVVKCSSAYRHLLESHTEPEPILPPPAAPTVKLKVSRRLKKELAPPLPIDLLSMKVDAPPVHTATPPLTRIVLPQPELYLDEASTSAAAAALPGEVQVCMESGELPVVSIQDTEDLPLGENITDDIFAIMNSEGIGQSSDDIPNVADWKNIIRDIGNMQEINFPQTTDSHSQDMYANVDPSTLAAYTITESDLASIQFAPSAEPLLPTVIEASVAAPKPAPPAPQTPGTPSARPQARSKSSKTKFNLREYDPNKHCGVVTAENPKPCTRSLTCKAHALSLRRTVEGRAKPFDTLLAEHRAARDPAQHTAPAPAPSLPPPPPPPPLLVGAPLELAAFGGLTAEQQVNDIYASLLSVEESGAALPDTSAITSLLSQPLPLALGGELLLPDDADEVPVLSIASPPPPPPRLEPPPPPPPADAAPRLEAPPEGPPAAPVAADVCWYAACPRPLALCTFNASHAGGAITLGKKFATVRSNIKSSLSRSQCKATSGANSYYYNPSALSLSKTVHMNASKTNKPEVRKLIVTCSATSGRDVQHTLSELFAPRHALNGHVTGPGGAGPAAGAAAGGGSKRPLKAGGAGVGGGKQRPPSVLDGFGSLLALDSLLADDKC